MNEIDSNRQAWNQVSKDHYFSFKKSLSEGKHRFNKYILQELGDISGKTVIHLQCNTGADTILLAKMGKSAAGVDFVPDNIQYAKMLAKELNICNVEFIESDIMTFMEKHHKKYDIVFVSEGAVCWLPDLKKWAETVRHLLKDDGFFYIFDNHPFYMMFDEHKLSSNILEIKYPYFGKEPDVDEWIGGYASEAKRGVQTYTWMYTVSDLITSLTSVGLHINYFHEFPENFYNPGGMQKTGCGLWNYGFNTGKFPMSFSLKATVYK